MFRWRRSSLHNEEDDAVLQAAKIVKYFLDPKTFQKVKFVYPKNEESVKLMYKYFDPEVLPVEFGGKSKAEYDHEEFSKLMREDEIKLAKLWGLDEKPATSIM